MSIHHLRGIVSGNRKTIKSKDVCQVHVPHFDSLSIEKMLDFAKNYPEVFEILPEEPREINILHRQYIANVIRAKPIFLPKAKKWAPAAAKRPLAPKTVF